MVSSSLASVSPIESGNIVLYGEYVLNRRLVPRSRSRPSRANSHRSAYHPIRTRTLLTSNRPVEDWGKLLGDSAAVTAMLDRLLHHGHILKCGPRSWRTKTGLPSLLSKG